jgi:hypothetical protein
MIQRCPKKTEGYIYASNSGSVSSSKFHWLRMGWFLGTAGS